MESLVILPVVYLTRQIDFEDPTNLMLARVAFALAQLLAIGVYLYLKAQIAKGGPGSQSRIRVKREAAGEDDYEEITVKEYDERELAKMLKQMLIQIAIIGFIHYKWNAAVPLVIQLISGPMRLYKDNLVQAYIFGEKLPRPFPVPPSAFSALMGGGEAPEEDTKQKKKDKKRDKENKDD